MSKHIRPLNIFLAVVGLIGIILIVLVLLPSNGSISATIDEVEFANSGLEAFVDVTVKNESWKPIIAPNYTITITSETGEVVANVIHRFRSIMWGNEEINYKNVHVEFNAEATKGDVEVVAGGWAF